MRSSNPETLAQNETQLIAVAGSISDTDQPPVTVERYVVQMYSDGNATWMDCTTSAFHLRAAALDDMMRMQGWHPSRQYRIVHRIVRVSETVSS